MGILLFVLLVLILLTLILAAGGYSVRRYWSPAGSEVVETEGGVGAAGGVAAAIAAMAVLILLVVGFSRWNWFGASPVAPATTNNPTVASPLPSGAATASPSASPSPSK